MSGVVRTLRVNADRMAEELDAGYTQATDLSRAHRPDAAASTTAAPTSWSARRCGRPADAASLDGTSPAPCSTRRPAPRPGVLGPDRRGPQRGAGPRGHRGHPGRVGRRRARRGPGDGRSNAEQRRGRPPALGRRAAAATTARPSGSCSRAAAPRRRRRRLDDDGPATPGRASGARSSVVNVGLAAVRRRRARAGRACPACGLADPGRWRPGVGRRARAAVRAALGRDRHGQRRGGAPAWTRACRSSSTSPLRRRSLPGLSGPDAAALRPGRRLGRRRATRCGARCGLRRWPRAGPPTSTRPTGCWPTARSRLEPAYRARHRGSDGHAPSVRSAPLLVGRQHRRGHPRIRARSTRDPGDTAWFGRDTPAAIERLVFLREVAGPMLRAVLQRSRARSTFRRWPRRASRWATTCTCAPRARPACWSAPCCPQLAALPDDGRWRWPGSCPATTCSS